jgi:hypothetical protein
MSNRIINISVERLKKKRGILDRIVDNAVNNLEQKFENAVEGAVAKGLSKIGLSDQITSQISARFNDAFSIGRSDTFFRSATTEQNRVSPREIEEKLIVGAAETTMDAVQAINQQNITNPMVMQFPDQIGQYYMSLDFQQYYRPSPQMEAKFKRFRTILLPIPRDLKENFDLNIGDSAQGALAGGLADLGIDVLRGAGDKVSGTEFAILYGALAQKFEGTGADILGQALGAVPNPHLQALFSGVELRNHSFQWTFAPRNPQESKNLKTIINEIKKNSLPAYSTTGTAVLLYPPMVEVKLMPWGNDLIRFKKCLIKSVSVNYAPAGLPSFFASAPGAEKYPTMIQLEIQLVETEIQTAMDYGFKPGDRPDGLEQAKDAVNTGVNNLGLGDVVSKTTDVIKSGLRGASAGAEYGTSNIQAGTARKQ